MQPDVIVYLTRHDRIAQAASLVLAEQTGWWVDESQTTPAPAGYSRKAPPWTLTLSSTSDDLDSCHGREHRRSRWGQIKRALRRSLEFA
ncbi:MAG: hypothetical protein F2840_18075 [Actinobacteria bacterium]|nr:hypothetical protein [Actinomycetota bacterium]